MPFGEKFDYDMYSAPSDRVYSVLRRAVEKVCTDLNAIELDNVDGGMYAVVQMLEQDIKDCCDEGYSPGVGEQQLRWHLRVSHQRVSRLLDFGDKAAEAVSPPVEHGQTGVVLPGSVPAGAIRDTILPEFYSELVKTNVPKCQEKALLSEVYFWRGKLEEIEQFRCGRCCVSGDKRIRRLLTQIQNRFAGEETRAPCRRLILEICTKA